MKPSTRPLYLLIAAFLLGSYLHANPPLSPPPPAASQLNLNGDGVTDNTDALQNLLDASKSQGLTLTLPPGTYLLGSVRIPANTTLRALPGAKIRINPTRLQLSDPDTTAPVIMRKKPQRFLILTGDNITLDGLDFDFTLTEADDIPATQRPAALITGDNVAHIRLLNLTANRPPHASPLPISERKARGIKGDRYPLPPKNKVPFHLSSFTNSTDLLLRDSRARFMHSMINLARCSGIVVESNRAENCFAITRATQADQYLRHTGNWSREVSHQCRWWGGNANDRRNLKPDSIGWGTAPTVIRHSPTPGQPGYNPYTVGAFDIVVANNYAEYGQTLAWGAKGRQVLFQGNTSRFMTDYALGSEGGENVIFTGNTVINSLTAGLVTMYWTEKVVMTGNTVLVRDEPMEGDGLYSWYSHPAPYQGGLIRLHAHGSPLTNGAGQVIITGNLLVNELTNRPRNIAIEAGRDVLISNNKIRNGTIRAKGGAGRIVVTGNDFSMTIPHTTAWLNFPPTIPEVIIKNNTFKNTRSLESRSPTEMLIVAEAGPDRRGRQTTPRLRIIEGNIAQGFPIAIFGRAFASDETPSRFLIAHNTLDGILRFEGQRTDVRLAIDGNRDLATMQALKPEILERIPVPLPPPEPTPEDAAAAMSDGTATSDNSATTPDE